MSVAKKIFNIKTELSSIHRNADGYKFKYTTLTNVKDQIDDKLNANKLLMIPSIPELEDNKYTFSVLFVDLESEDKMELLFKVKGDTQQSNEIQSSGATMSYMQRYIPKLVFDLDFVDDDPDHKNNSAPKKDTKDKKSYRELLKTYCEISEISVDQALEVMKELANKTKASELTQKEYNAVINKLDTMQRTN